MSVAAASAAPAPLTIAGHPVVLRDRAGGILNLRIGLNGGALVALARALAKLGGVRVTSGPESAGRERCYVAHCPGFKMVVSAPDGDGADFALALVSRTPQVALAVLSDLDVTLEHLMSAPPPAAEVAARAKPTAAKASGSSPLRRTQLAPGKPLSRRTGLTRKTPLGRGRFR